MLVFLNQNESVEIGIVFHRQYQNIGYSKKCVQCGDYTQ